MSLTVSGAALMVLGVVGVVVAVLSGGSMHWAGFLVIFCVPGCVFVVLGTEDACQTPVASNQPH